MHTEESECLDDFLYAVLLSSQAQRVLGSVLSCVARSGRIGELNPYFQEPVASVKLAHSQPPAVVYCTVLHCTALHCTVLCCAVLYCTHTCPSALYLDRHTPTPRGLRWYLQRLALVPVLAGHRFSRHCTRVGPPRHFVREQQQTLQRLQVGWVHCTAHLHVCQWVSARR
jgi:hypothetical protein